MATTVLVTMLVLGSLAGVATFVLASRVFQWGRPKGVIPGWGTRTKDCPYPPEHMAAVLGEFLEGWKVRGYEGGDKVKKALDALNVYFVPGTSFQVAQRAADGSIVKRNAGGACSNPWTMKLVGLPLYKNVRDSSFPHELTHIALWAVRKNPEFHDADGKVVPGFEELPDFVLELRKGIREIPLASGG
jgi:hypothetical protein